MDYETVLFEVGDDHVATITINRPQAMNSVTVQMCEEFAHIWKRVSHDDNIHAVLLRAAPGRAFCTGVDVKNGGNVLMSDNLWTQTDPGDYLGPKANKVWKPVIAAVHGLCAGGAFYWINEADIVICSEDAQFFDPHVTYGMVAALEPIGLRQRAPLADVLRMVLMGNDERIGADPALRISLVTEVVELDKLWTRAHELAATIAAKPPAATQGTVRAIWESLDMSRNTALHTGLKYCLLGNPLGTAQVSRAELMAQKKTYTLR